LLLCPPLFFQIIAYDEFLPAVMGHKLDSYPGYDDSVDPRISTEFATSGYRLGHSMVSADMDFFDDNANVLFPVRLCVHAWVYSGPMTPLVSSFIICGVMTRPSLLFYAPMRPRSPCC
jgi:hypothetical protein